MVAEEFNFPHSSRLSFTLSYFQAVTSLAPSYLESVIELQSSAPSCLATPTQEPPPVFSLPDGSRRWSWARDSGGNGENQHSSLAFILREVSAFTLKNLLCQR